MKLSAIRILAAACILACVLTVSACFGSLPNAKLSYTLGIDLSNAEVITETDTHGGFHGDGISLITLSASDPGCLEQIKQSPHWKPLPLRENVQALVYGMQTEGAEYGPYITAGQNGAPAFPVIENGYYFFLDRHSEAASPYDDSAVFSRYSFNLTVAIYDQDAGKLYYSEFDT